MCTNTSNSEIWVTILGGIIAGIILLIVNYISKKIQEEKDKKKVFDYLRSIVKDEEGKRWVSTRKIASYNKLPENRVRYICSIHNNLVLSTGDKEDMWGLQGISRD